MTPAANFSTSFADVVDAVSKLATIVNDALGKLPPCQRRPWQIATVSTTLACIYMLTLLPKGVQKK
jgi:hypothetical protein